MKRVVILLLVTFGAGTGIDVLSHTFAKRDATFEPAAGQPKLTQVAQSDGEKKDEEINAPPKDFRSPMMKIIDTVAELGRLQGEKLRLEEDVAEQEGKGLAPSAEVVDNLKRVIALIAAKNESFATLSKVRPPKPVEPDAKKCGAMESMVCI